MPALYTPAGTWTVWPEMFCPIDGDQPHSWARGYLVGYGLALVY
jgi:hypothetical protein